MRRLLRFLFLLLILAAGVAVAYVALTDLPAPTRSIVQEVPNDVLFPRGSDS